MSAGVQQIPKVEVGGGGKSEMDKEVWQRMRLVDVRYWRKEDSVALAAYAASLVLTNFEQVFPQDNRPRKAIEAAQKYLNDPSEENRSAADSAARSADSAADSAARSAARSAYSAADSAARSADSAARSAYSAARSAYSAAYSAFLNKVSDWAEARFDQLPVFEEVR